MQSQIYSYANIETNAGSTAAAPLSTTISFNVYYFIIDKKKAMSMTAVDVALLCS